MCAMVLGNIMTAEQIEQDILGKREALVQGNVFFKTLHFRNEKKDWAWCSDLYHLSREFIELLRLRHQRFPKVPHDVFESHYQEEIGHANMLRDWMVSIGLPDPAMTHPSKETEDFISILYRAATVMDEKLSLLIINSTAEGFALDLFTHCVKQLKRAGISNDLNYWEIHCEADEEHCNVAQHVTALSDEESDMAQYYVDYTLSAIDKMLVSWSRKI